MHNIDEDSNFNSDIGASSVHPVSVAANSSTGKRKGKKFKDEEAKKKWEDMMTAKRRKVYTNLVKKEIGKQHRAKINKHKEMLIQCKRVALQCQKAVRQRAVSILPLALKMWKERNPEKKIKRILVFKLL